MIDLQRSDKSPELGKIEKDDKVYCSEGYYYSYFYQPNALIYKYIDNNGIEKTLRVIESQKFLTKISKSTGKKETKKVSKYFYDREDTMLEFISGDNIIKNLYSYGKDYGVCIDKIIDYAQLLDKIFGTDWTRRLMVELEEQCKSEKKYGNILKKLEKSYDRMYEEYKKISFDFRGSEQQKRESFYQKYVFKERLKDIEPDTQKKQQETQAQDKDEIAEDSQEQPENEI